jgi:hypothetical protein
VSDALLDTYRGSPLYLPGQVFADLAVAFADGVDAVTGIEVLRDREALFGPVASMPTAWRLLDRIDGAHLPRVRAARAAARERAWQAGAAPEPGTELRIDFDATISIAHGHPAIEDDGLRDGAWVAEATGMIGLSSWPPGSRLILRKERPHPGAQLTFTDVDDHRITAFLTDTGRGVIPGQAAGLELRHRQHARVEDRIRQAKAAGLRNLPCRGREGNSAWLEAVLTATDLVCWAKLICFAPMPSLARCEIAAFRYRVLHVAARLTRSARQACLRIDRTWRWAAQIAEGFHRLRAAFA